MRKSASLDDFLRFEYPGIRDNGIVLAGPFCFCLLLVDCACAAFADKELSSDWSVFTFVNFETRQLQFDSEMLTFSF